MVNGACRAGWVAIAIAALLASPATAQATRTVRQAERARADAQADAARAQAAALAAETELATLGEKQADAAGRKAETEQASLDATLKLTGLELDTRRMQAALLHDREAVEDIVIAALFAERAGRSPDRARMAARAEAVTRAVGEQAVAQARTRAAALAEMQAAQAEIAEAQEALVAAQSALAAEEDGLAQLIAAQQTARNQQLASARAAERRARRYAAEARSLRELAARVQPATASRRTPVRPLGALVSPVAGRLVTAFGQRSAAGHRSDGLTYSAEAGADVVSPANATVSYAGLFRSYGEILILDLDNGYVIVLAGMGNLRAQAGDRVQAGQVVGQMPRAATPAPELYVEVRRGGTPVDPSRQFARGA